MKIFRNLKLQYKMLILAIIPVLIMGIVAILISNTVVKNKLLDDAKQKLKATSNAVLAAYDQNAGDYFVNATGDVWKGAYNVSLSTPFIDDIAAKTGIEVTFFYNDKRLVTSLKDADGKRILGSTAGDFLVENVLQDGNEVFTNRVLVDGTFYFGYYVPIYNKDGSVVGMAFASKTRASVMAFVRNNVINSVAICVLVTIAALLCCIAASQKLVEALKSIMDYLGHLANSDFSTKMPISVLRRKDEIGAMGSYAATVSCSLKDMITTDPLTGLLNRRACRSNLQKMIEQCRENRQQPLSVTIGDIDFFKRINDTYGHECGDMVLKSISNIFKKNMEEKGLVSRWGGEEFLLVFELPLAQAQEKLEQIADEIRETAFAYEGETFSVSLTFGLTDVTGEQSLDEIVKEADDLLYRGKAEGRNRIVTSGDRKE